MEEIKKLSMRCVLAVGAQAAEAAAQYLSTGASKRLSRFRPTIANICDAVAQTAYGDIRGLDPGEVYSWGGAAVDVAQRSADAIERAALDRSGPRATRQSSATPSSAADCGRRWTGCARLGRSER